MRIRSRRPIAYQFTGCHFRHRVISTPPSFLSSQFHFPRGRLSQPSISPLNVLHTSHLMSHGPAVLPGPPTGPRLGGPPAGPPLSSMMAVAAFPPPPPFAIAALTAATAVASNAVSGAAVASSSSSGSGGGGNTMEHLLKRTQARKIDADDSEPVAAHSLAPALSAPSAALSRIRCVRCEQLISASQIESHADSHSSQISRFLFLGGDRNAKNLKELQVRTRITHIVNMAWECANHYPNAFTYANFRISDHSFENIFEVLEEAVDFIGTFVYMLALVAFFLPKFPLQSMLLVQGLCLHTAFIVCETPLSSIAAQNPHGAPAVACSCTACRASRAAPASCSPT